MSNLKVSTEDPLKLKDDINDKIDTGKIASWEYDVTLNRISHKGGQYKGHFFYEFEIDDPRGILEFKFHAGGSGFANSRAYQLLERMLTTHFSHQIEIIK